MNFLDKKEQVLDIELTQHGKRLLALGKMKPTFYAFFDDDIIYDSVYAGFSEERTNISNRIRNETPKTSVQYNFSGVETELTRAKNILRDKKAKLGDEILEPISEKHFALSAPLGNSDLSEKEFPSWKVKLHKGEISSSLCVLQGNHQTVRIPQINAKDAKYQTRVGNDKNSREDEESNLEGSFLSSDINIGSSRFEDNTFIELKEDFFLLQLSEENVPVRKDNFDIEVFLIEDDLETGDEVLTPLSFEKKEKAIENNILKDQTREEPTPNVLLDGSFVEHYFHLFVDEEISKDLLCHLVPKGDREAAFPGDFLDCDEFTPREQIENLYGSDAIEEEDC